jgi:hypothetical protein
VVWFTSSFALLASVDESWWVLWATAPEFDHLLRRPGVFCKDNKKQPVCLYFSGTVLSRHKSSEARDGL